MDEAYEIGIRIALDNGVAQAAPALARDLAMLDRAIAATEGRMAGLRVPAAPLPTPSQPSSAEPVAAVEAPPPSSPRAAPVAVPETPAREAAAVRLPESPLPPRALPVAPVPVASAAAPVAEVVPVASPAMQLPPALPLSAEPAMPLAAAPEVAVARVLVPPPAVATPAAARVAEPLSRPGPMALPATQAAAPVPRAVVEERLVAAPEPLAAPAPPAFTVAPSAVRPEALRSAPAEAAPAHVATHEDAGPEQERVIEGRLEIDGALLGRWVAEYMGREAGRSPGGTTAVDPRMSTPWAGALQG